MASLYSISEDILRIFSEVECQDGEITDSQYAELLIKEDELKEKLTNYVHAIKEFQKDADFCKEEKKNISARQNVYKNRVERLKAAVLTAVIQFGNQGKTNKFIELANCRVSTRSNKSIIIDENRINIFMEEFERFVRELVNADILYAGKDVDLEGILDAINANCRAAYGENFELFTISDLTSMKINISQTASVYDLFKSGLALTLYGKEPTYTSMENVTDKDTLKEAIEISEKIDSFAAPTIAKVVKTDSIIIK